MQSVAIVIPARYSSSRFPGKPLADILGKPMIQHVYEKAASVKNATVVVATDDKNILSVVNSFGGKGVMTSSTHASGTDRLVEVMNKVDADLYINLQGDEPLVRPEDLELLINAMAADKSIEVGTLYHSISAHQAKDPNTVKVVTSHSGRACYFSRSPIPFIRDKDVQTNYKQHVGVYAYRKSVLEQYSQLAESEIEIAEQLEQLRLLDSDIDIYAFEVMQTGPGVDTPEDLEKVIAILQGKPLESEKSLLSNINLVITDIDGVLTDGGIYYDEHGECIKRFHVRDGLGIKLLQQAGIQVAVLSGKDSKSLRKRISDLGIDIFMLGIKNKEMACQEIIQRANTIKANTVYIGDDTIDLPAFISCGVAVAVADAPDYVKVKCDLVTNTKGGFGALRELADKILIEQGQSKLIEDPAAFLKIHADITQ
ncbi:3-deoxy-manno-octulosonate cytidylyltransferase [Psychrobacter sp. AOP22-C1-22]|uniref:3-deoxy-manno-octulosonate cytidylyltransferase n=1 Tax=unclassified Psychrobacter TaxID=196806 RepID=UPI00178893E0|nr:3-deoxy-manno-octulosonate cytidylyltransferase [Psychrobacter sp. FME6]MBE0405681.1 3-deoxy-manno-octulosonate cytidylyltransferase [Psychrobacter sp. FME6]